MPKDYRKIESKSRIRRRGKEFIKKHMQRLGGPQNVKYLTFLGASDTELREITDPLGISRENVICVENNKETLKYIHSQNWGVEVYPGDMLDFVMNLDRKITISNLDFEGKFKGKNISILRALVRNQVLEPNSIVITNFYGQRETEDDKRRYFGQGTRDITDNSLLFSTMEKVLDDFKNKRVSSIDEKPCVKFPTFSDSIKEGKTLDNFRDIGITTNILDIFFHGMGESPDFIHACDYGDLYREICYPREFCSLLRYHQDFKLLNDKDRAERIEESEKEAEELKNILSGERFWEDYDIPNNWKERFERDYKEGKYQEDAYQRKKRKDLEEYEKDIELFRKCSDEELIKRSFGLRRKHKEALIRNLKSFGFKENTIEFFLRLWETKDCGSYICTDLKRFKYNSDAGSKMYTDFFFLEQFREELEYFTKALRPVEGSLEPYLNKMRKNMKNIVAFSQYAYSLKKFREENPDYPLLLFDIDIGSELEKSSFLKKLYNYNNRSRNPPKRIDMGSSYKKRLTGPEYYNSYCDAVNVGKNKEELEKELLKKFRTNIKQIRAFHIHTKKGTYGPLPISENKKEEVVEKKYSLRDIINTENPLKFYNKFPGFAMKRLHYFLKEDLPYRIKLSQEEKEELTTNISKSRWFRNVLNGGLGEEDINTFFDDIMIYTLWNGKVPETREIREIYQNSRKGLKDLPFKREHRAPEISETVETEGEEMPKGKPYIDKEEAINLLKMGTPVDEIVNGYRGFKKSQLRAIKAHITMGTYDHSDGKPPLEKEEAYKLLRRGWAYDEIEEIYDVKRNTLRAYKAWITMRDRDGI